MSSAWLVCAVVWVAAVAGPMFAFPAMLTRGGWWMRRPRLAGGLWVVGVGVGVGAFLAGVVGTVAFVVSGADRSGQGVSASVVAVVAWAGMAVVGALAGVVLTRSEPLCRERRSADVAAVLAVARATYRVAQVGRDEAVYVRDGRPYACALPSGSILVSSGLEETLTGAQVRAVIEHERAHLHGRHERFVMAASLAAACCPVPHAARALSRSARLLVELAADDVAARACGPAVVCNALTRLGELSADEGMLLRARRLAVRPVRRHSAADRDRLAGVAVTGGSGLALGTGLE